MLHKIKLSHFRQHIEREFTFGPGLNAVRGEVEAGKTTIVEAFTYFCFGARALREKLEDVVTYHHPVSKLRIDVVYEHLGVMYTGYRGKSGAEVSFGSEKITGQTEVTKFFENLFGATADMAGKMMFASQKALAESLKAGPTDAGKMIESLANFDLIDRVAGAIQACRPTGVTTGVDARIAQLRAQLEQQVELEDLAPLRHSISVVADAVKVLQKDVTDRQAKLEGLALEQARQILADDERLGTAITTMTREVAQLDEALAAPAPAAPTDEAIAEARRALQLAQDAKRASSALVELQGLDVAEQWDEPVEALVAAIEDTQTKLDEQCAARDGFSLKLGDANKRLAAAQRENATTITRLEGRLIKETTCALCQKDLSEVPEVVNINLDVTKKLDAARAAAAQVETELTAEIVLLEGQRDRAAALVAQHTKMLTALRSVQTFNNRIEQVYAKHADYIEVNRAAVPGTWRWTGPVLQAHGDAAGALRALEAARDSALQVAAKRGEWQSRRDHLQRQLQNEIEMRAGLRVKDAQEELEIEKHCRSALETVRAVLQKEEQHLQALQADLRLKEAVQKEQQHLRELAQRQLSTAEQELATMQRYNALLKKVRAARPEITNKLWNIVLGGASKYFSDVRGTPSLITRDDGMFKYNGYPVAGLSGSAEDMLGLSLRIALTRTFLPGVDILNLDEPAAACSDARELKMLGMLSTLQFGQTILISHSDAVDSFADRIITV